MPYANKLKKLAEVQGVSEKALVVEAVESSPNIILAAKKLGITRNGLKMAMVRLKIKARQRNMIAD